MFSISKVELLIDQRKYKQAEKELKLYLVINPDDGIAHSVLSKTYLAQNKFNEALSEAQKGVSLAPESSYTYYSLSRCYIGTGDLEKAEEVSLQALKIEPEDEHCLCNHAMILNDAKKYNEALETIDKALLANPEHGKSKQIKSVILRNKGKYNEADRIADDALSASPESSSAFAIKGWALLDKRKNKEALEHFKTAVMLDPNNQHAKSGLVYGIKAQNKIFDIYYRYHKWIKNVPPFINGLFFIGVIAFAILVYFSNKTGSASALIFNVVFAFYLLFILLIWTMDSIFNLFLRFNKYGKYALNKGQAVGANVIAILLVTAPILLGIHYKFDWFPIRGASGALFLIIPVTFAISQWSRPKFKKNIISTTILTIFWIINIVLPIVGFDNIYIWIAFLLSIFIFTSKAQK